VAESHPGRDPTTAEVRIFSNLFNSQNPAELENFLEDYNPNSLQVLQNCVVEDSLKDVKAFSKYQFERVGFFSVDSDSTPDQKLVFNLTVGLRESKSKIAL